VTCRGGRLISLVVRSGVGIMSRNEGGTLKTPRLYVLMFLLTWSKLGITGGPCSRSDRFPSAGRFKGESIGGASTCIC